MIDEASAKKTNSSPFLFSSDCPAVSPPNLLPHPDKPYFTPSDNSTWKLPRGSCASDADKAAVQLASTRFVRQGVTARPQIHPTFYAPLPDAFDSGCTWLAASATGVTLPRLQAMFEHGLASAVGWADANGYCAQAESA